MDKIMKGKVAVVTGASRGIGRAIALELASKGADIVLNYRNDSSSMESIENEIKDLGSRVISVKADVSIFKDAENLIKKAAEEMGTVDILVNNAGITKDGLILRMKEEDFDKVINVNLKGAFNCIKNVIPVMLRKRSGKIVNISSVVGITGNAGQANYSAAKAGIIGLTKSTARELASRGINVNAVAPGFIKTSMTDVLSDKVKQGILSGIPLNKIGESKDVAKAVSFLASEDSNYITGQVINIDGGMVM